MISPAVSVKRVSSNPQAKTIERRLDTRHTGRILAPFMTLHQAIILNGLQELSDASLSAPDCRVTFEANGNEHWLECSPAQIRMDWPFAAPPAENEILRACFGSAIQVTGWEPDAYVTLIPGSRDVDGLITGIDLVFQDLYGLGPGYTLTYRMQA